MKKEISYLMIVLLFSAIAVSAEESLFFKSDDSWKATNTLEDDWFSVNFNDKSWGSSIGNWENNPCAYYKCDLKSCELGCNEWMWYGENCTKCTRYFRKEIEIPDKLTYGSIRIAADDSYELYINGKKIHEEYSDIGYQTYYENKDIKNELHSGKNIIAIKVSNKEKYSGVVVTGEIRYESQIGELQSKIELLNSQIVVLTEDKKRLQSETDKATKELDALRTEKDVRDKQLNALEMESIKINEYKSQTDATILQERILLGIIALALIITAYFAYSLNKENAKLKEKRTPSLSAVSSGSSKYKKHEPSEEDKDSLWEE